MVTDDIVVMITGHGRIAYNTKREPENIERVRVRFPTYCRVVTDDIVVMITGHGRMAYDTKREPGNIERVRVRLTTYCRVVTEVVCSEVDHTRMGRKPKAGFNIR